MFTASFLQLHKLHKLHKVNQLQKMHKVLQLNKLCTNRGNSTLIRARKSNVFKGFVAQQEQFSTNSGFLSLKSQDLIVILC